MKTKTTKRPVVKKAAKKITAKPKSKVVAKKTAAPKKTTAPKAKVAAKKKPAAKKSVAKKVVAKKSVAKKVVAKKSVAKKVVAKKAAPTKTVTKKVAVKKTAPTKTGAKKVAAKKTAPTKTVAKKVAAKKSAPTKTVAKKTAPAAPPSVPVKPKARGAAFHSTPPQAIDLDNPKAHNAHAPADEPQTARNAEAHSMIVRDQRIAAEARARAATTAFRATASHAGTRGRHAQGKRDAKRQAHRNG